MPARRKFIKDFGLMVGTTAAAQISPPADWSDPGGNLQISSDIFERIKTKGQ